MNIVWTKVSHISEEYEKRVSEFLQYIQEHTIFMNETYYFPYIHYQ